jgi:hypothetical protein
MALISVTISGNAAPLKKSLDDAESKFGKFGGAFTKLGVAAAAGVGALAAGIGLAAKAAAEDQKSFELMEVAIRNVTGATEEHIAEVDKQLGKMSLATGIADDKLRPAFAALTRGTRDIERATKDFGIVLDVSTALGMDQTVVAEALAKGYEGNMKALAQLSPELKTMIKDGADMNDVLDVLSANFGGATAAAADTFSGKLDRLKVFSSELVEQLGYYFLPILTSIAEFIVKEVVPAFQGLIEKYGPALAAIFQKIADFISDRVVPVLRDQLIPFIQLTAEFIGEKLIPIIRDVALIVFDKFRKIFEIVSEKVEENSDNIQKYVGYLQDLGKFVTTYIAPVLTKTLAVAFDVVAAAIGPVLDIIFTLMGALGTLGSFLVKVAGFVVRTIEAMINPVIDGLNLAIRAANFLSPGNPISEIPSLSLSPSFGSAPVAPTQSGTPDISGVTDSFDRTGAGRMITPSIPTVTAPTVLTPSGGGGGGGGGGAGSAILVPNSRTFSTNFGISDEMLFGATASDGQRQLPNVVNINVTTTTTDGEFPNKVVEALQQYNLVSGPLDVQIAV